MKGRIKIIQGGSSAGKTFSVLSLLILRARHSQQKRLVSLVAESFPHLRRGALRDFLKILQMEGLYNEKDYNKTHHTYTLNQWTFEFFSAESPDKLRGARRDILFMNEANNMPYEAFRQLSIRTSGEIYIDFNPTWEFWAHTELMGRADTDFIKLTYPDNQCQGRYLMPQNIIDQIESHKHNENWWRVYGLGEIGRAEGVIFQNWIQIEALPENAQLLAYGLDFGYTNDPTALAALYRFDGEHIYHQVLYQKGLLNREIAALLQSKGIGRNELIVADSSEPKSIAEINAYSYSIKAANKGPDSLQFGLSLMNERPFKVTKESVELIRELRNYVWILTSTADPSTGLSMPLTTPLTRFKKAL